MKLQILFLKIAVIVIGIPVLALGIFGMPWLVNNPVNPAYANIIYPVIIGMYITAIPFFFALINAFKLLSYIEKNNGFSEVCIKALKKVKYSGAIIGIIYGFLLPFIFLIAEKDDAPGLIIIGMAFVCAPIVIAAFASVLQGLVEDVIDKLFRSN